MEQTSTAGAAPSAQLSEHVPARAWLWGVPFAVAVFAHLPSLQNGFVHDDPMLLTRNPNMEGLEGLAELMRGGLFAVMQELGNVEYYRPLSSVLYWLSWQLFGESGLGQHALNLCLHGGVAVTFGAALRAFGASGRASVLAASLFAVHPATADIVAYVGGRQDMLGWLLSLLAIRFALLHERSPRNAAVLFVLVLGGCLSREFFFAAPCWIAALCIASPPAERGRALVYLASVAGAAVVLTLMARVTLRIASPALAGAAPGTWVDAFAFVSARVLRVVGYPIDLAVEVTVGSPLLSGAARAVPITLLVFGGAAVLVLGALRRGSKADGETAALRAACAVVMFVAVLLATFALHTVPAVRFGIVADRYAYGPVMACVAMGWALGALWPARVPRWTPVIVAALCVGLVPVAWARDIDFASDETLNMALLRNRPEDPQSWIGAGTVLFIQGKGDAAYPLCERYRRALPHSSRANLCVGDYLLRHGQPRQAAMVLQPYVLGRSGHVRGRQVLLDALIAMPDRAAAQQALAWLEQRHPGAPDLVEARGRIDRLPIQPAATR